MFLILICLLTAIYTWKILITCYTSSSVFFCLSFNSKNIHVNNISYAKMSGWPNLSSDNFENIHVTKVPNIRPFLQLIRNFILSTRTLGMPPLYIKSSYKSKVVLARNTEKKLKFH